MSAHGWLNFGSVSWGKSLRFLPSITVAVILLVALSYSDRVHQGNLTRENRNNVTTELNKAQLKYASLIAGFVRESVNMGAKMPVLSEVGQKDFATVANQTVARGGKIIRAELAPRYFTTVVSPHENNQHRIGSPPSLNITNDETEAKGDPRRVFPTVRKVRVIDNRSSDIGLLIPLYRTQKDVVQVEGVVFIVGRFDLDLTATMESSGTNRLEHLFKWLPRGKTENAIPKEWQIGGDMEPVGGKIEVPGGAFLILVRSLDGWNPSFAQMLDHRLRLLAIGLFAFVFALAANWLAFSHLTTSNRLTETEDQMSGVLQNLPGAALTYTMPASNVKPGPEDQIVFLNKNACWNLWGVEADVAEADVMTLWDRIDTQEATEEFSQALVESAKKMSPLHHVWSIHTSNGVQKWLEGRGHPVRLNDGSVQWSAMIHDASDQILHEQELEQQRELAFRAQKNDSMGHLTGGIAHDFNNLLAVIMGTLELLLDDETDQEKRRMIESAITSSLRGADLTKNMLAFARKARLTPEIMDFNTVVRDAHDWIGRTLPETIVLETSLSDALWNVAADRSSMESALLNLILNARDAMDGHGTLTIETANIRISDPYLDAQKEQLRPGRYVMLAVSDTGHGIPETIRDEIFEPFFSTKAPGLGTGLGLSMVMGFMRQSEGAVQLYTAIDQGTSIKLFFPAAEASDIHTVQTAEPTIKIGGEGQRLLIVEDETAVRVILKGSLERAGYRVTEASSGDEAYAIFEANPEFDLLLTDIVMPGDLQGPGLARLLREKWSKLPVIFLSGYANEATFHSNNLRPEDIRLMKPVQRVDLLSAVSKAMELAGSGDNSV